ncbi:MAG: hypothetical protein E7211_08735 [Clostridium lundense]|nr:hypothetical protein [Clostridium lundense]
MSLNEARIKQKVKKSISIMPTNINLKRIEKIDDGMGGYIEQEIDVATFDGLIDDSNHSVYIDRMNEAGTIKRTRSITLLAVCEDFEIKDNDYFEAKGRKYKVAYATTLLADVYNCDLEVIG